ncbi:hypothetical protein, partial [Leptospira levettii]|uniref:hypothetical protein n=1 Tax=Leptospira levettii TaxID=2023178 RepID=UPI0014385FB0
YTYNELSDYFEDISFNHNILIESTSIGITEIYAIINYSKNNYIDILYFEPKEYSKEKELYLTPEPDFALTKGFHGFYPIDGRIVEFGTDNDKYGVVFLGYESNRIERMFEEFEIDPFKIHIIAGLPAFNPGWELNTFSKNIDTLIGRSIQKSILYSSAYNPIVAFEVLDDIYKSLNEENMYIAPFGTKPHGIASAIFAYTHPDVFLIYDHPRRSSNRSIKIGNIHLYSISR